MKLETMFIPGRITILFIFLALLKPGISQTIPRDRLYLGQTPPGNEPKVFKLEVTQGAFAAERIAISKDGSEIYYSEIKGYYPVTGAKIRYYKFADREWKGSSVLFDGFIGPALSVTGDTMFLERDWCMYYSVKKNSSWSKPVKFFTSIDSLHIYRLQIKGNTMPRPVQRVRLG